MRLMNTQTLVLEEYFGDQIPRYAILSHTWRDQEVTYHEWQHDHIRSAKKGFWKIYFACLVAQRNSIGYIWVDTNCINKDSSTELSEAINSMFTWYRESSICFVYLDDFHYGNDNLANFEASRWFTRGWTLQELLAPSTVQFFDASWTRFGTKYSLVPEISKITCIHIQYLLHPDSIRLASVARRMSWAATRSTTREEDMAYCLLGIFEINMPLLYGEGGKAFIRLQEEIIRHSNDHTIFCWSWPSSMVSQKNPAWRGCLSPRPIAFRDSGDFIGTSSVGKDIAPDFQLTNSGLRISPPLLSGLLGEFKLAVLNAKNLADSESRICLCLREFVPESKRFARSLFLDQLLRVPRQWAEGCGTLIYLAHERDPSRRISAIGFSEGFSAFTYPVKYAIFPVYFARNYKRSLFSTSLFTTREGECHPSAISGDFLSLNKADEENIWWARIMVKTPKYAKVEISFKVRIEQPQDGVWDTTIKLRQNVCEPEDENEAAATQNISLSHASEFIIKSGAEATLVRPVLVSFSFLGSGDEEKSM